MPTRRILDEAWVHGTRRVAPGEPGATGKPVREETWEILFLDRVSKNTIVYTMTKVGRDDLLQQLFGDSIVLADGL